MFSEHYAVCDTSLLLSCYVMRSCIEVRGCSAFRTDQDVQFMFYVVRRCVKQVRPCIELRCNCSDTSNLSSFCPFCCTPLPNDEEVRDAWWITVVEQSAVNHVSPQAGGHREEGASGERIFHVLLNPNDSKVYTPSLKSFSLFVARSHILADSLWMRTYYNEVAPRASLLIVLLVPKAAVHLQLHSYSLLGKRKHSEKTNTNYNKKCCDVYDESREECSPVKKCKR